MKIILYRFGITLSAIALGVILITGLTLMGEASSGPVDDLLTDLGNGVSSIENELIIENRVDSRTKALVWINKYTESASNLKKPDHILLGAYDNSTSETFEGIVSLEQKLNTTFPLIHVYTAWGSRPEESFPMKKLRAICNLGSIPVVTWEPWLTSFEAGKYPLLTKIEERDINGLKSIAKGDYDFYITEWAKSSKKLEKTFFIRFGHEMNDPYRYPWGPQNNKPEDYIAAWKHVVDIFRKQEATNVIWIWSPHTAYKNFNDYYPGDDYVDWIGTGVLNYGTVATWSQWWSFKDMFSNFYTENSLHNKPIMICEFGSLNVGGDRASWYTDALCSLPKEYSLVKALVFYHSSDDQTTTNKTLDWQFKNDSAAVTSINTCIKKIGLKK
jgi:hypothetical protein